MCNITLSCDKNSMESEFLLWKKISSICGLSVKAAVGVRYLCNNLEISCSLNKRSQSDRPLSFLSLCEKMTEENRTATNALLSKTQKETNKRPIKKREWGNRWRVKRCENHKRRKKDEGWEIMKSRGWWWERRVKRDGGKVLLSAEGGWQVMEG